MVSTSDKRFVIGFFFCSLLFLCIYSERWEKVELVEKKYKLGELFLCILSWIYSLIHTFGLPSQQQTGAAWLYEIPSKTICLFHIRSKMNSDQNAGELNYLSHLSFSLFLSLCFHPCYFNTFLCSLHCYLAPGFKADLWISVSLCKDWWTWCCGSTYRLTSITFGYEFSLGFHQGKVQLWRTLRRRSDRPEKIQTGHTNQHDHVLHYITYTTIFHLISTIRNNCDIPQVARRWSFFRIAVALICESRGKKHSSGCKWINLMYFIRRVGVW